MSTFKQLYESMPELLELEHYQQIFNKMSFEHDVNCCFHPRPKLFACKQQLCDMKHTRDLYEGNEIGHICNRTVLIMSVIRAVLQGKMVVSDKKWYFSTRLYEKRVFLMVTMNSIRFINADFNGIDYHPLTRLIFWLTALAPNNYGNKCEMTKECSELLLKQLHRDGFLRRPCILVDTKSSTAVDLMQCTTLVEVMKLFDDSICSTCQRSTQAFYYDSMIQHHYQEQYYLYFCLLAPLINGWFGTDSKGRSSYNESTVKYQSGDDLVYREHSYHYVTRSIFNQFLSLGYVEFNTDSDDSNNDNHSDIEHSDSDDSDIEQSDSDDSDIEHSDSDDSDIEHSDSDDSNNDDDSDIEHSDSDD